MRSQITTRHNSGVKEITIIQEDAAPRQEYEVTPTALVYGGDALARLPDGRAVFIPFILPGECARVRYFEEKPATSTLSGQPDQALTYAH